MGANKKRQATHIAPLQPRILAAFRPWGGSAGAGRVRPAGRKYNGKLFVGGCRILVKENNFHLKIYKRQFTRNQIFFYGL